MLVITRKQHETFLIGDDIRITILRVDGNSVKVGIVAPEALERTSQRAAG